MELVCEPVVISVLNRLSGQNCYKDTIFTITRVVVAIRYAAIFTK